MRFRFDTYLGGDSVLHRLDPRAKIILLFLYSISSLAVRTWWGIGALAVILVFAFVGCCIPFRTLVRSMAFVIALGVLSVLFALMGHPDVQGFLSGLQIAVRMLMLVAGSLLVSFTSSATDMVAAFRNLMRPFAACGLRTDDAALLLSLALRFIPVIGEEALRIRAAQEARGAGTAVPVCERLQRWGAMFSSVFVGLFRRADTLSLAMDARCYGILGERTSLNALRMGAPSAAILCIGSSVLVALCVFL